jgi:hypothetical protein
MSCELFGVGERLYVFESQRLMGNGESLTVRLR